LAFSGEVNVVTFYLLMLPSGCVFC